MLGDWLRVAEVRVRLEVEGFDGKAVERKGVTYTAVFIFIDGSLLGLRL